MIGFANTTELCEEAIMSRKPYPSDVTDEEWAFVKPYLTLMREDAPQREHDLREVFNGLLWIVRTGSQWRMMPHDLPPWYTVYQLVSIKRCLKRVIMIQAACSVSLALTK